jgi:hypothetical protein
MTAKETYKKLVEKYGKEDINSVFNGYNGFIASFNEHLTNPHSTGPITYQEICDFMEVVEPDWQRDC